MISGLCASACFELDTQVCLQARQMLQYCSDNHKVPSQIRPLKLYAVKWHTAVGLALCLGLSMYPSVRGWQMNSLWA